MAFRGGSGDTRLKRCHSLVLLGILAALLFNGALNALWLRFALWRPIYAGCAAVPWSSQAGWLARLIWTSLPVPADAGDSVALSSTLAALATCGALDAHGYSGPSI